MSRVLIIGLDGATLDLVEPWAKSGKLPVIEKLMKIGSYSILDSVLPVLSSSAWVSFMTGMNPGKHGFYDFVRRESDSYKLRLLRRDQLTAPTLWQLLNRNNKKIGALNVPMTFPPEKVNGFIVSGLGTPDYSPFTYPLELGPELLRNGYRVNKRVHYKPGNEDDFLNEVYEITDRLTEAAINLMHQTDWDLFMLVYRDTDEMAHFFWKHMDPKHPLHNSDTENKYRTAILEYYQKLDGIIGQLVSNVPADTNILIISDHGGGPLNKDVYLNEWLKQQGYLVTKKDDSGLPGFQTGFAKVGLTRSNISSTLRRLGLSRLEYWIKSVLGDKIEILPRTGRLDFPDAIDWEKTRAYSFGYHGQIYVNLKNREPEGIVHPGVEYDSLIQELKGKLYNIKDPIDGLPVIDKIFHKNEVYRGPFIECAPDLILIMRNFSYITRQGYEFGNKEGQIFSSPATFESGSHRMEGLLVASGPNIKKSKAQKDKAELIDIAPTVLHLLDSPIPEEMDGRVLLDWINVLNEVRYEQSGYQQPDLISSSWSEKDEQKVIDRLKQMGYLE